MARVTLPAQMFKSPRKFVEDREDGYRPIGTVSFQHTVSIEGEGAKLYADTDLTTGLNGSRAKLDSGDPVAVDVVLDLRVARGGKLVADLVELRERGPVKV